MNEDFATFLYILTVIVIAISSIFGGVTFYEISETSYDKCTDKCEYLESTDTMECLSICNEFEIKIKCEGEIK